MRMPATELNIKTLLRDGANKPFQENSAAMKTMALNLMNSAMAEDGHTRATVAAGFSAALLEFGCQHKNADRSDVDAMMQVITMMIMYVEQVEAQS